MKTIHGVAACACCLLIGAGLATLAGPKVPAVPFFQGKEQKAAGLAALETAERLAEGGSWERIGVGRVYYLSGDKARGQALFDAVAAGKVEVSDWQRIGAVYEEAGEKDKAEAAFQKALAGMKPGDDTGQCEVGAFYIRNGQREKGEELLGKAFAKNPNDFWNHVRAAEAYLGVAPK